MLEDFTVETFANCVGEHFLITVDDATTLDARLVAAVAVESQAGDSALSGTDRTPFSIVFLGPLEPVLPQRIYRFEHDALGTFELFIVPIGPDESGMQYEAVFN